MKFKPNRPVRVGTTMLVTDANGELPRQPASSASQDERPDLSRMTKAQLIDVATAAGIEIDSGDTKAGLIAKIEQARG